MTAGLSGNVDFIPIPSGGAQAVLSGAQLRYIVGQSLKPQWIIVTKPEIKKVEDLQRQDAGLRPRRRRRLRRRRDHAGALLQHEGRPRLQGHPVPGRAGADRGAGQRRHRRRAGLGAARLQAKQAGFNVLLRTGDYLPRAGGTFWCTEDFFQKNPETVKKFIRAIAKGVMYYRDNKEGSFAIMKEHLGVQSDEEAGVLWEELHNTFAAELPADLYREIFESRRIDMIAANQWPKDKPLPDPEQYPGARHARCDAQGDELRADQDRRQAEVTTFVFARLAVVAAIDGVGAVRADHDPGDGPRLSEQGDPNHRALHARLAE